MNPSSSSGGFFSGAATLAQKTIQVFTGNDAQATEIGRQSDPLITRCGRLFSFSWTLNIQVTGQTSAKYPRLVNATAGVAWMDSSEDLRGVVMSSATSGRVTPIKGSKPHAGACTCEAPGWYLEAQRRVSIDDGENQTIDLVMKPTPWVSIQVVDHESGDQVRGVTAGLELKRFKEAKAPVTAPIPDGAVLEFETLDPGSDLKILGLEHGELLLEAIEFTSIP